MIDLEKTGTLNKTWGYFSLVPLAFVPYIDRDLRIKKYQMYLQYHSYKLNQDRFIRESTEKHFESYGWPLDPVSKAKHPCTAGSRSSYES